MRATIAWEVLRRTETLLARSRELEGALVSTLVWSRRILRLPPRTIRGGGGLDGSHGLDPLRPEIRRRLIQGALPFPSAEPWAGRGSGGPCAICRVPISERDVEYEVTASGEVTEGDTVPPFCVHLSCYVVWREEAYAWEAGRKLGS